MTDMNQEMSLDELLAKKIREAATIEDLARTLQEFMEQNVVRSDGLLMSIKAVVGRYNGLRFEIHTDDHDPPHFHVVAEGIRARFTIEDCLLLKGDAIGGSDERTVRYWHKLGKTRLIEFWDRLRPSDSLHGRPISGK